VTATELFKTTSDALAIAGFPEWKSPDAPGECDALVYLDDDVDGEEPIWALVANDSSCCDDCIPIDATMACELIEAHLCNWLLDRAWQTQVVVQKGVQRWRLVDCLSMADGGGDRLDHDYPTGHNDLEVLCESVMVVSNVIR
jgi:hypothetical protein